MNYYVIYKGSGGLIHMLCGLVYCMNYCINNDYILIIDVIGHSCYKHYLSDFFIINNETCSKLIYSEDYSIVDPKAMFARKYSVDYIKNYTNVEVPIRKNVYEYKFNVYPLKHALYTTSKRAQIRIYAGFGINDYSSIIKFIKVRPDIKDKIKENLEIDNYIGVHFRNTDIQNDFNIFCKRIEECIKKTNYKNIYLATDDATAYDKFKNKFPNHNIYQYTKPINSNGEPIHYAEKNKYNLILNVLTDIYFLYKSNDFINSDTSTISRLILVMKKENKSIFE